MKFETKSQINDQIKTKSFYIIIQKLPNNSTFLSTLSKSDSISVYKLRKLRTRMLKNAD